MWWPVTLTLALGVGTGAQRQAVFEVYLSGSILGQLRLKDETVKTNKQYKTKQNKQQQQNKCLREYLGLLGGNGCEVRRQAALVCRADLPGPSWSLLLVLAAWYFRPTPAWYCELQFVFLGMGQGLCVQVLRHSAPSSAQGLEGSPTHHSP